MINYSPQIRTFKEISDEFEFVLKNLNKKVSYYKKLISKGHKVPSAGAYFEYAPLSDVRQLLELEVNRKYTLELTSAFEAKLVYYFKHSLNNNRRAPFYLRYQAIVPDKVRRGTKHMMLQHLIDVFKDQVMPADHLTYTQFHNLVVYRNWLAHGRGWELPIHLKDRTTNVITDKFDYQYSFQVITNLITHLPRFPNKLKE